jgi:hypothetical protein
MGISTILKVKRKLTFVQMPVFEFSSIYNPPRTAHILVRIIAFQTYKPSRQLHPLTVKHYIPSDAPFGTYVYTTTINSVQGNEVINEDSFEFEVVEY